MTWRNTYSLMLASSLLALAAAASAGPPPVSYSKQVLPLLRAQCWSCHSGPNPASGFSMETREKLLAGGRHGAAITVGKGAQSNLVRYLTGDLKPRMPPGGATDLEKIAVLRRWIDEGAKIDSNVMPPPASGPAHSGGTARLPVNTGNLPAPVTALAYAPDGSALAVAGYRAVRLLDPATGNLMRTVPGAADQVQAVAWSSDGKYLAVGGGVPGLSGEIIIYETQTWKPLHTLAGHSEVVYAVAWKPNTREIATGSLDKSVRIWDADTGQCRRVIKDHADAVFGVAYSPDGRLLATGSADRSVKLFDTTSWKRVAVLTAHQDTVTHVAFNPNGTLLATAGADRQVRVWKVEIGKMENPLRSLGDDDVINTCAFSPDSSLLVWGASDRSVRVFNGDGSQQKREMKEAADWVYAVAVGKDNQTVAAGTQDGKVLFWNAKEGRLLCSVTLLPGGAKVESTPDGKK